MGIKVNTTVEVSAKDLVQEMSIEDIADLLDEVAQHFESKFAERKELADTFAEYTSEVGARFLAEVIASTVYRTKKNRA